MTDHDEPTNIPTEKRAGLPARLMNYLRLHPSMFLWILIVALLVMVQWPQIKGGYYSLMGIAAPADNIPWRTDYQAALQESAASGKPVLLDFSADWCPPCKVMKHEVWPDADVRKAVIDSYIPVYLDVDNPASQAAANRYAVRSIPSLFIVDSQGNVLKQEQFLSRRGMLDFLSTTQP